MKCSTKADMYSQNIYILYYLYIYVCMYICIYNSEGNIDIINIMFISYFLNMHFSWLIVKSFVYALFLK